MPALGTDRGGILENLISENAASLTVDTTTKPKTKSKFLPVLIVLFVVSYGLMCTLVVEQGSTIEAQRFLIRQLLGDSTELSAMKGRDFQKKGAEMKAQADAQAQNKVQAQDKTQAQPKTQVQTPAAPASPKATDKGRSSTGKVRRPGPHRPPQDASEMADERRSLISI